MDHGARRVRVAGVEAVAVAGRGGEELWINKAGGRFLVLKTVALKRSAAR